MLTNALVPVLGFVASSGTGKTTLLRKVLPILCEAGLAVGMVKHAHHEFEIDYPGKDSFELRKAGAAQMLITSKQRWALMVDHVYELEPPLNDVLLRLDQSSLDLIIVEGFKHERFSKIEVHRGGRDTPRVLPHDDGIVAFASDAKPHELPPMQVPILDLNKPSQIADFVMEFARH